VIFQTISHKLDTSSDDFLFLTYGRADEYGNIHNKKVCLTGQTMMKRDKGIITILVGIGLLIISIFFSSGYHPHWGIMGNLSRMRIVLVEGEYVKASRQFPGHFKGSVTIPLKYPLSLSVILILTGTGIVLVGKNKAMNA